MIQLKVLCRAHTVSAHVHSLRTLLPLISMCWSHDGLLPPAGQTTGSHPRARPCFGMRCAPWMTPGYWPRACTCTCAGMDYQGRVQLCGCVQRTPFGWLVASMTCGEPRYALACRLSHGELFDMPFPPLAWVAAAHARCAAGTGSSRVRKGGSRRGVTIAVACACPHPHISPSRCWSLVGPIDSASACHYLCPLPALLLRG